MSDLIQAVAPWLICGLLAYMVSGLVLWWLCFLYAWMRGELTDDTTPAQILCVVAHETQYVRDKPACGSLALHNAAAPTKETK